VRRDPSAGDATRDRLNEFASVRALTIAAVGPLSEAQLEFSPRPGRWSVGEIADHLLLAEDLYRGIVVQLVGLARAGQPTVRQYSFAEVNVAPLHLPNAVLSWMAVPLSLVNRVIPDGVLSLMMEYPILPTRTPDVARPRAGRPGADLKADLAGSIVMTRALIESNADLDFNQLISEHPVTGRTNIAQILTLLARHERRHQGQMEGVRADPRFPAV
jgi:uncharacterized damage-inducible protein DinB